MSKHNSVRPEDILPDEENRAIFGGVNVWKGTIAAFLANITILEDAASTSEDKKAALGMLKELAPAVIAINLHKHVVFKNTQVEKILKAAE